MRAWRMHAVLVAVLAAGCATEPKVTLAPNHPDSDPLYQIKGQPPGVASRTATEFCARMQSPAVAWEIVIDGQLPKGVYRFECGPRFIQYRTADGTPIPAFEAKCTEQDKVIRTRTTAADPYTVNIDCVSPQQIPER